MAKSKNHTAHNQTYKQHKNGIKKPKAYRYSPNKGVSCRIYQSFCYCSFLGTTGTYYGLSLTAEGPQIPAKSGVLT